MAKSKEITIVSPEELSLVTGNVLNENQLGFLLKKTPEKYLKKRPAKGGGDWDYVSGGYVKKCLNLMFGWNWSFEIMEQLVMHGEAIVKGKLSVTSNGVTIVKMQFGNKDIAYKNEYYKDENGKSVSRKSDTPLSIGNDLKAAATDCLKKCASELGIAADVYNKEEFRDIIFDSNIISWEDLQELYDLKKDKCTPEEQANIEAIIHDQDKANYRKTFNNLSKL